MINVCVKRSHIGHSYDRNEDSVFLDPKQQFFVIADGIGGLSGGDTASQFAVDFIKDYIEKRRDESEIEQLLLRAVVQCNSRLFEYSKIELNKAMGTTLTCLFLTQSSYYIVHIGDSRCYLIRDSQTEQLTFDQTVGNERWCNGEIKQHEIHYEPGFQRITQALGLQKTCTPLSYYGGIRPHDIFLLSTDGFHNSVQTDVLADHLRSFDKDPEGVADKLLETCLDNNGQDNISFVIIQI